MRTGLKMYSKNLLTGKINLTAITAPCAVMKKPLQWLTFNLVLQPIVGPSFPRYLIIPSHGP